jgi:hypothetical protein
MDGWDPAKGPPLGNENWDVWGDFNDSGAVTSRYLRGDMVDQAFGLLVVLVPGPTATRSTNGRAAGNGWREHIRWLKLMVAVGPFRWRRERQPPHAVSTQFMYAFFFSFSFFDIKIAISSSRVRNSGGAGDFDLIAEVGKV